MKIRVRAPKCRLLIYIPNSLITSRLICRTAAKIAFKSVKQHIKETAPEADSNNRTNFAKDFFAEIFTDREKMNKLAKNVKSVFKEFKGLEIVNVNAAGPTKVIIKL